MIGDDVTASRTGAKMLEALALIAGRADDGRVITLATPPAAAEDARRRLADFVREHGACVRSGFLPEQCAS